MNILYIINSNVIHSPQMVANFLGQFGTDYLNFLWLRLIADHAAQTQYGITLDDINDNCLNEHIIDSEQAIDCQQV